VNDVVESLYPVTTLGSVGLKQKTPSQVADGDEREKMLG